MQNIKENKFLPDITFVCHYFPPDESVGIRRVLFWVNYFSKKGIKVLVVTTKKTNSAIHLKDLGDNVRVVEYSIFGFSNLDFSVTVNNTNELSVENIIHQESRFIRFLKVIKRKYLNPMVGQLSDPRIISVATCLFFIRTNWRVSALSEYDFSKTTFISTAPPWPLHFLGLSLANKYDRNIFLDYRDPFSSNHMFSSKLSFIEKKIDTYLCSKAEGVFSVSESWVEFYSAFSRNVYLLRNGYDKSLFVNSGPTLALCNKEVVRIGYFGSVEHKERFPQLIFDYIEAGNKNVVIEFYGVYSLVEEYLTEKPDLYKYVKLRGKKPYEECLEIMRNTDVNLLCETFSGDSLSHRGVIPTKLYEYIAAKRPILAMISNDSDMIPLLKKSGLLFSQVSSYSDLKLALSSSYINSLDLKADVDFIDSLTRQSVAEKLLMDITNV